MTTFASQLYFLYNIYKKKKQLNLNFKTIYIFSVTNKWTLLLSHVNKMATVQSEKILLKQYTYLLGKHSNIIQINIEDIQCV